MLSYRNELLSNIVNMTPEQQATAHRKSVERVHQQIEAEHQAATWRARVPERLLRLIVAAQQTSGVSVASSMTDTNVFASFIYIDDSKSVRIYRMLDYSSDEQDFKIVEDALLKISQ